MLSKKNIIIIKKIPENNFVETTVTRSATTEVKSESGGEETIVVAERPRVYPKGNYYSRGFAVEVFFNSNYQDVKDFYNNSKRISRKPTNILHPFGNPFPLLEIPFSINRIEGIPLDDPSCYYIRDGVEKFRMPFFRGRHILYGGNDSFEIGMTYRETFSSGADLKLNFSDNKGENTLEIHNAVSFAFIKIAYNYFNDYDPRFKDIK